ncbi:MAG TPA: energy transducer TonB [Puia sp.]|jgi:protein TonB|nr:energy transducer TonB [Puia sp.]
MKKLPFLFLLILNLVARSQGKDALYVFDENWKPTKIKSAKFLLHTHQVNDTCWQWDYYNFVGPLINTEQYRDKDGKELNGNSYHYNVSGFVDSTTTFRAGKRNGDAWKFSGDSLKYRIKYIYREDSLVEVIYPDKQKKDSSISYKDEKESEYPGGKAGWSHYLMKNLKYPDRAISGNIQGKVSVSFIVDKDGYVIASYIAHSVEYSLDEEALRIIKDSGKWEPAFQNGHNVKSYKLQPLNFSLQ